MKRILSVLILVIFSLLTFINPALALDRQQRRDLENRPWWDPTDCYTGGTSTGGTTPTGPAQPGQTYIVGDSLGVGLRDAGQLEKKLTDKGFPTKINANGARQIKSPGSRSGAGPYQTGLEAVAADTDYIKGSKNVIIELGTNDGNNPDTASVQRTFPGNQDELLNAIKATGFSGKLFWVDVAAVGNGSNYYKDGAQVVNQILYDNLSKGYSPISQFKFVWGDDQDPKTLASKSLPDPKGFFTGGDGVHYTGTGYGQFADFIVNQMAQGGSAGTAAGTAIKTDSSGSSTTLPGFSPDPKAVEMFDAQIKQRATELAPLYQRAAAAEGLKDWQVLVGIHYLEFGFQKKNPTTNVDYRTPFQMNIGTLLANGVSPSDPAIQPGHDLTDDEFVQTARWAIQFFIKTKGVDLSKDLTIQDLEKIYIGYKSGSVYPGASPTTHAYTYAGFDTGEHKLPMFWGPGWGTLPDGRTVRDQQTTVSVNRPGAATIFGLVKGGISGIPGGSAGGGTCSGQTISGDTTPAGEVASKVVEIAQRELQAWTGDLSKYPGFHPGAWCADFTNFVYKEAGRPLDNQTSVQGQQAFFQEKGVWHPRGDGYTPQPGDIVVYNEGDKVADNPYPQHVNIVISVENGILTTIGGNEGGNIKLNNFASVDAPFITGYGRPR